MTDTHKEPIKCTRCKCWRKPKKFIQKKTGRKLKTCKKCRKRGMKSRNKNKCEHNRRKSQCTDCGGSQICEHNRRKNVCRECGGSQICEHNRERRRCKKCRDPKEITFKNWIMDSRKADKKANRYDPNNFVDYCFLRALVEENDIPVCIYCSCELQFIECNSTLATIERMDNSIGHIKSNCVLACYSCNLTRSNRYTFEEFKAKFKVKMI